MIIVGQVVQHHRGRMWDRLSHVLHPLLSFPNHTTCMHTCARSSNTTEVDPFDHNRQALPGCNGDEPQWIDPTRVEAFEYGDLAGATKQLERKFDDLTGISPLWLSVDGDEPGVPNFSGKGRRGGRAMFGDWQLDDSLVEAFENQTDATQHDKQVIMYNIYITGGWCTPGTTASSGMI